MEGAGEKSILHVSLPSPSLPAHPPQASPSSGFSYGGTRVLLNSHPVGLSERQRARCPPFPAIHSSTSGASNPISSGVILLFAGAVYEPAAPTYPPPRHPHAHHLHTWSPRIRGALEDDVDKLDAACGPQCLVSGRVLRLLLRVFDWGANPDLPLPRPSDCTRHHHHHLHAHHLHPSTPGT